MFSRKAIHLVKPALSPAAAAAIAVFCSSQREDDGQGQRRSVQHTKQISSDVYRGCTPCLRSSEGSLDLPNDFSSQGGGVLANEFPSCAAVGEALCSCEGIVPTFGRQRSKTRVWLENTSSTISLESRYKIDWDNPLGEGGYGAVFMCTDRRTGKKCALKVISKQYTDEDSFQREIDALLRVRESGGHPNICSLIENFEKRGDFYLVLDLIDGGEMFDQLVDQGPYSEADAARHVMETASSLAFLHGVGLVHADLKPENLMLSTHNKSDSVIKLVDFGCSEYFKDDVDTKQIRMNTSTTPAYSPPEAFSKHRGPLSPSFDMWSMGCILYIMLTGVHPFDPEGGSTDEEMERRIKKGAPPLRNSPITAHLSDSAIDLIEKLLHKRPRRRMTAMQMLDHPWVKGETAKTDKIEHSDKKLGTFRKFKSRLEVKVFSDWVSGATSDVEKKTSLIERAFVTAKDLNRSLAQIGDDPFDVGTDAVPLSLSGLSDLISDHMVNKYYPEGYRIYKEGAKGDFLYFINSGTVEVTTKAGFKTTLSQGALFGEGALLDTNTRRSATISCLTPVHVIRVSKEYFDKYMKGGGSEVNITLSELDRTRDVGRAMEFLRLQNNLVLHKLPKGEVLFSCGDHGDSLFIVDEGEIEIKGETGNKVNVTSGEMLGEQSVITGLPRNATAVCATNNCKVYEMGSKDFFALYHSSSHMSKSFERVCFRRVLQNAMAKKFGKDFGVNDNVLRKAFDVLDLDQSGSIKLDGVRLLLRSTYPSLSSDDKVFLRALKTLDATGNNLVSWEEFKTAFSKH